MRKINSWEDLSRLIKEQGGVSEVRMLASMPERAKPSVIRDTCEGIHPERKFPEKRK